MPKTLNVLLVEDSEDDAVLLVDRLQEAGFRVKWQRVETAAGFEDSLSPSLDLILSDFSMPQFSVEKGLALLAKSRLPIPFIIVSGTIGEESAVESLKAGATDYILKDRLARLGPVVRRALAEAKERAKSQESELRLRQLAENIQEVFWMTDLEKNEMLYISPAYERIWGRTIESLGNSPREWMEAIHPDDRSRVAASALANQVLGKYDEVYRILRPDGTIRWIRDRAYPIRDEKGRGFRVAGTAEDITEQRHLEAQLRQAQKMEAIGTLAGGIAHDFNNILAAIMGYSELAKLDAKSDSEAAGFLDEVGKAAGRAKDLVRQILTFSRQQEHQRVPMQLRHVVGEALKLLRAGTPSTITFDATLSINTPMTLADATQIHQIVMNLGTNAAHAMRNQGVFKTSLEKFKVTAEMAAGHPDLKPGLYARLSMADTGHGMDRATLQRIFDPFFTTKGPGEGTGLGLAVVHGIMKANEGCIEVFSEPGKGARFELYFPAILDADIEIVADEKEIPLGNGEQILLVEDEETLLKMAQKMFERIGYRVTGVTSPAAALELAGSEDFSLAITDLTMPVMTGLELAKQLKAVRPNLRVILTTGNTSMITPEVQNTAGIYEILAKPYALQAAAEAIRKVLAAP